MLSVPDASTSSSPAEACGLDADNLALEESRSTLMGLPAPIFLRGIRIDPVAEPAAITLIMDALGRAQGGWVVTLNVDVLRLLVTNPGLQEMIKDVSLMLPDGMPLLWASRLHGAALPGRVAGSSLILALSAAAAEAGASIFLLGGKPGVAHAAGAFMLRAYPRLRITGIDAPPFGFDRDAQAMARLRRELIRAQPDIVYACFGFPKQERVISELRVSLPRTWFLGLGGSFDMIAGLTPRAPLWVQKSGMEWAWRMLNEPRRLFRRYLIDDLPFAFSLLLEAVRCRLSHIQKQGDRRKACASCEMRGNRIA